MKFDDFIKALQDAGWKNTGDAQYSEIKKLWRKMFPVIAELEDKVFEQDCIIRP